MAFRITQGDTSPAILSSLTDDGEPVDLSSADTVRFIMEDKYEQIVVDADNNTGNVSIVDAAAGEVEYGFSAADTETVGTYKAEWEVTYDTGAVETFPTGGKITIEVFEEIA